MLCQLVSHAHKISSFHREGVGLLCPVPEGVHLFGLDTLFPIYLSRELLPAGNLFGYLAGKIYNERARCSSKEGFLTAILVSRQLLVTTVTLFEASIAGKQHEGMQALGMSGEPF